MELTQENKDYIDSLSYESLLSHWRFAPSGNVWFQGETGSYWAARMKQIREQDNDMHVSASKRIGWD